jgi:acetyltransferase-like isoleucine patch superfamily enzyme
MVGTSAVATKDVEPYHIKVGIPAKTVRIKRGGLKAEADGEEDIKRISER